MKRKLPGKRILAAFLTAVVLAGSMGNPAAAEETVGVQEVQEPVVDVEDVLPDIGEEVDLDGVQAEADDREEQAVLEQENTVLPEEDSEEPEEIFISEEAGELLFAAEEEKSTETDMLAATAAQTEGTPITAAGSEYRLVTSGSEVYKGNYNLLGDANNKSSFVYIPFNNAGNNVVYKEVGGVAYFVPQNADAAGKYGFLVQNVGFNCEKNCKLDMRFTVTEYKNYTLDRNGEKVSGIYPAFGFWKEYGLCFAFLGADQNVQVEILEHGTNNLVQGNYSFRWLDIDAGQRFGMNLIDGELTGRYAMTTCSASYQNDFSRFKKTYQMVNAAQDVSYIGQNEGWMDGTVYWEVKNCSRMNLLFASAGSSTQGRYWADTYRLKYEQYLTGNFPDGEVTLALLNWNGESYGPRENPMALYKYVSNQEEAWEVLSGKLNNTVASASAPFYYYLSNYVPVESPAYYYNLYTVTDTLPSGVDYNGAVQVIKAESGADVTGWFDVKAENDVVTFSANHMGESEFYGSTYIFKIKAKIDTGEITPSYSGNKCVYTVNNTASVSSRHQTDTEAKTAASNPVTTTLEELGKGKIAVKKTSEDGKGLDGAVFEIAAKEDIKSPAGELLVQAGTVTARLTTVSGKAVSEELYAGKYLVREVLPPKGYSLNTSPVEVSVNGLGNGGEIPCEVTFQNAKTLVVLKKISEQMDGESEKQGIPGVKFCIWNKQSMSEENGIQYETDADGQIVLQGYAPGTYCFREISAREGYVPDEKVKEFVIDDRGWVENEYGHVIEVENACIKAEFAKTDKATGELVPGAELQLADQNGNVIETWVSGQLPHRINRIPEGTYILSELQTPDGYKKGEPVTCVIKASGEIQSFALTNVKYVKIRLTKMLYANEIVWAHGNPVFTFELTGTDLDGGLHTYYDTVEFKETPAPEIEGEAAAEGDMISRTVEFNVPAGRYEACELKTARYALENIENVEYGTVQETKVLFDLSGNQNGAASFINKKINDEGLSDTDFVRNIVIP